ncbi:ABA4-like family protein [Pelagibacteraceae bacterium]|nr:ABA4-like family protein [Pelagibacteraceae bacterium]|tara:strand:+ start:463 stop:936 length:474 start_codon:yes stop_codon:yes gene_type:complete
MLIQFNDYLTFENIYLWANFGVLPFWLMLIFIPNSRVSKIFLNSMFLPLIFGSIYTYVIYQIILLEEPILNIFNLYLSLENLYIIFATESFLLLFWIHYLIINLFIGFWVARDGVKYNISKKLILIPIIFIYFAGPLGLVLYWFIRIFYSKKLGFYD